MTFWNFEFCGGCGGASDNDYEYDDEYDSHEDGFEVDVVEDDSKDEFECWKSKQQSNLDGT